MTNQDELLEEESSLLTLTDEKGNETQFEFLDSVEYQGVEYLVLTPYEDEDEDSDTVEVVILAVEPVDEEYENYYAVEDTVTLNAVYDIFKEKNKDVLNFDS